MAFKKARRTGNSHHFDTYKNLRYNTSTPLRAAHSKYLNEVMSGLAPDTDQASAHISVKRAWSYLKLLRTDSTGIPTLFWDNRVCSSNQAKAEALRGHMPASTFSDVPDIYFSSPGVLKPLGAIRPDKARFPDQIPARILREAPEELAPYLRLSSSNHTTLASFQLRGKTQISPPSSKKGLGRTTSTTGLSH